ncbi:MAG: hypothetical protein DRH37_04520 [Deltaproteobacteria bacterium]|nr:MAG: hypothetical protein DRH37_04520 [Deltaproteobacteria bacterium]
MGIGRSRRRVGSDTEPCPQRHIEGWFVSQAEARSAVKCGDRVVLCANSSNLPPGTPVSYRIKQCHDGGRTLETLSARLESVPMGAQVDKDWISKKTFRGWDRNCIHFRVTGGGASANSQNERIFHRYPNVSAQTKTFARTSTNRGFRYAWTGKYDIEFRNFEVVITVKIKLINRLGPQPQRPPLPAAGPPVDAGTKRRLKRSAEAILSNRWVLHRDQCQRGAHCNCNVNRQCCKFRVRVNVQFVESGEHHRVDLFQGRNRYSVNSGAWGRIPWDNLDYGHEIGHLLGWYDEYDSAGARGAIAPSSSRPPWRRNRRGSIMHCSGTNVPKFYYDDFKDWFSSVTSEPWELVSG